LYAQLAEAQETLDAIRNGDIDALVIEGAGAHRIYTLETADRTYRHLIEQMGEGALMLNSEGVVLYANEAMARMLGTPTAKLIGAPLGPFVQRSDAADFTNLLKERGKRELKLRRADGEEIGVQISLSEMTSEDGTVLSCVVTDLTESHAHSREMADIRSNLAVQSARHESDERYRLILESASDYAILATDLEERLTTWNTGARIILGWEPEEVIGATMPLMWTPEDRAAGVPQEEMRTALEQGRAQDERWHLRKDGSRFWAHGLMMPLRSETGAVIGFLKILRDRSEERRTQENQRLLINELNHRVKNTLAVVQSIASHTLRGAPSAMEARMSLEDRLMALSRVHDVLTRESWEGADINNVVEQAVAPYRTRADGRVRIGGPMLRLSPSTALSLAMLLQELATNAIKYGSLSSATGWLDIEWSADCEDFELRWTESGGPHVEQPLRRGFGSKLIERSLAEFGDGSAIRFQPQGVVCVVRGVIGPVDGRQP